MRIIGAKQTDPVRLEKMRRVADGRVELGPFLFHVSNLARVDEVLDYLLRSHLCGDELFAFMRFHCNGSILRTVAEVLRRIDHNVETSPIILGRDYL